VNGKFQAAYPAPEMTGIGAEISGAITGVDWKKSRPESGRSDALDALLEASVHSFVRRLWNAAPFNISVIRRRVVKLTAKLMSTDPFKLVAVATANKSAGMALPSRGMANLARPSISTGPKSQ
jgi:hypothetical protein